MQPDQALLAKAKTLERAEEWGEAASIYEEMVARDPSNLQLLLDLGIAYDETGRIVEADETYGRALEIDPLDVDTLFNLGMLRLEAGDIDQAKDALDDYLSLATDAGDKAVIVGKLRELDQDYAICDRCGCVSQLESHFSAAGAGKYRCPRCNQETLRAFADRSARPMVIILVVVALVGAYLQMALGQFGFFLINISVFVGVFLLLLFVTGILRPLATWVLGGYVMRLAIGFGLPRGAYQFRETLIDLRGVPISITSYVSFSSRRLIRFRYFLVSAVGIAFEVGLVVLLAASFRSEHFATEVAWSECILIACGLLLLAELAVLRVTNLDPGVESSGKAIRRLISGDIEAGDLQRAYFLQRSLAAARSGDQAGRLSYLQAGYDREAVDVNYDLQLAIALAENGRNEDARRIMNAVDLTQAQPASCMACLLNNMAWVELLLNDDPDHLDRAFDYAQRAFLSQPWMISVSGTWADVLTAIGKPRLALQHAMNALEFANVDDDRATLLAVAAQAHFRLGEPHEAARCLQEAQRITRQTTRMLPALQQ